MDIDINATIEFNFNVTNILNRLIENPQELSIFMGNIIDTYEDVINESMNDNQLKYDPSITLTNSREITKEEIQNDPECCICIDSIKEKEIIHKCNHCGKIIHYNCMNEWIKTNNNCPICRTIVDVEIDYNVKFENWINNKINI